MKAPSTKRLNYLNVRLVGILRTKVRTSAKNAIQAIQTAFDAGAEAVEITSNSDYWKEILNECIKRNLNIGVGSVKNEKVAREAIDKGAKFLVSPGLFQDVISVAKENKIPILPGVYDTGEAQQARELGIVDVKFFPANVSTHGELYKTIREPFRDEFDELINEGWEIITYDSYTEGVKRIRVDTPTQFYKQYLYVKKEEPDRPIVIEYPVGKKGFERLKEFSDYLLHDGIRTYAVGGVNDKNMKEVLTKYGAYGVCPGSGMFNADAIFNGEFDRVKTDVERQVAIVKELFPVTMT